MLYTVTVLGSCGQWDFYSTPPHCCGALGCGDPSVYYHTAVEQWAVGLHQYTAGEHWVVELLQYAATTLGSSGRWNSFTTLSP